jgi:hypothetical protein
VRNFCSNICFSGSLTSEHNLCGHWCSPGWCPSCFPRVTYFDIRDSQAVEDARSRDKLIDLFICIESFFRRLEIYTGFTPTVFLTEIIVDVMVEVLSILGIATKEAKNGRLSESMSLILTILNRLFI